MTLIKCNSMGRELSFLPAMAALCTHQQNSQVSTKESKSLLALRMNRTAQDAWGWCQGLTGMRGLPHWKGLTQSCSLSGSWGASGGMPDTSLRFSEFLFSNSPANLAVFPQHPLFLLLGEAGQDHCSSLDAFFNVYHIITTSLCVRELNLTWF